MYVGAAVTVVQVHGLAASQVGTLLVTLPQVVDGAVIVLSQEVAAHTAYIWNILGFQEHAQAALATKETRTTGTAKHAQQERHAL